MIDRLDPELRQRLDGEATIWFTSVRPDGRPETRPVWFIVEGGSFLIYSVRGSRRERNIAANHHVTLNLDTDDAGDPVLIVDGDAHIDPAAPPADQMPAYIAKYEALIAGFGWTPAKFADDYPTAIRITPTRIRT
jgi:PPOX class probable F420-dependent enzyme